MKQSEIIRRCWKRFARAVIESAYYDRDAEWLNSDMGCTFRYIAELDSESKIEIPEEIIKSQETISEIPDNSEQFEKLGEKCAKSVQKVCEKESLPEDFGVVTEKKKKFVKVVNDLHLHSLETIAEMVNLNVEQVKNILQIS